MVAGWQWTPLLRNGKERLFQEDNRSQVGGILPETVSRIASLSRENAHVKCQGASHAHGWLCCLHHQGSAVCRPLSQDEETDSRPGLTANKSFRLRIKNHQFNFFVVFAAHVQLFNLTQQKICCNENPVPFNQVTTPTSTILIT